MLNFVFRTPYLVYSKKLNPVVDPPLGNSDHSSFSFSVKMGFKIPNITFSHKVYLKSRVDCPRVSEDFCNLNWSGVYNS